MQPLNTNITIPRRFSFRDRFICDRVFANNKSLNQPSLKHRYPDLYK